MAAPAVGAVPDPAIAGSDRTVAAMHPVGGETWPQSAIGFKAPAGRH